MLFCTPYQIGNGSICELVKTGSTAWRECEPERNDDDPTLLCYVACAPPDNSTCHSSSNSEDDGFPVEFRRVLENLSNVTTKLSYLAGEKCYKMLQY